MKKIPEEVIDFGKLFIFILIFILIFITVADFIDEYFEWLEKTKFIK